MRNIVVFLRDPLGIFGKSRNDSSKDEDLVKNSSMKSEREDDFARDRLIIDASMISPPPHHIHPWENMRELATRSGIINLLAAFLLFLVFPPEDVLLFCVSSQLASISFHLEIVFLFLLEGEIRSSRAGGQSLFLWVTIKGEWLGHFTTMIWWWSFEFDKKRKKCIFIFSTRFSFFFN